MAYTFCLFPKYKITCIIGMKNQGLRMKNKCEKFF
jgi:hypothetical protein